ncbi:MAG: methionine--tRNA ligase [Acidobacteria bacterium]|nr:methionine--tRNA ligase [Acidobacteriota bacterium]
MRKLITSALPYVNNVPHLGNIIGCVLSADVYARFCRARGYETLYVCGTDEYGTATENKAREEGLTPREICDKYHVIHRDIYDAFQISFDIFGRTSTPEQTQIAQGIFNDLDRQGLISEQTSQRTYCQHDQMFLADRYVEGTCPHCSYEDARGDQCDKCGKLLDPESLLNARCKLCGNPPGLKETKHLYLDLDRIQPRLATWFEKASDEGAWTRNAVQTTQSWLEKGLAPRPITRDLKWGIPVPKPGFEDKVFYVWFDAPIGYISITAKERPDWQDWWLNPSNVALYQFMAKDNIPFHTVVFPASLIGTGKEWTLLHHINSTEYLNYEDTKFSKSRNIGVFGTDVQTTGIDIDLWRFYLVSIRPERNDSAFVWSDFFEKVNSEFIDNIGNLVNRTLVYLKRNFQGVVDMSAADDPHKTFMDEVDKAFQEVTAQMEAVRLREALRGILALGNRANKFFQDMAPWEQIKTSPERAQATVSVLAHAVHKIAVMLQAFMPRTSDRLSGMLNSDITHWQIPQVLVDGHVIGDPEILFPKLDPKDAEKWRKRFGGEWVNPSLVDLRVGRVTKVSPHPHADRLYVLNVDLGESKERTIVAGLVSHYRADDLMNRNLLIVANLAPADLRGVVSEGMVLTAERKKVLDLFDLDRYLPGTRVSLGGEPVAQITFETFSSLPLSVKDGQLLCEDMAPMLGGEPIKTVNLDHGKVR